MFRVPVPDYSPIGFREALNNALLHRDYTRLDAVYVQWQPDHLLITSPGGFPVGITAENLLVHEPKPKNPRLAAACKRIGLVEQTGRGVDKIYMGQRRYGRPVPDYTRSDSTGVRVVIRGGKPSLDFSAFVFEQEDQGKKLELDDLLILNALFHERRIDVKSACILIQKGTTETKSALERLLERGLVEPRGERQTRTYHLSGMVYKRLNMEAEYIRAKGFEPHQHEQMVLDYVRKMGRITRSEAADMCHLSGDQASRLLRRISIKYEYFQMVGTRKGAYYVWSDPGK
jgi:ATP-dependent DNA helicase RecG